MRKVEWISQRCDPKTLAAHQLMEDQVTTCQPEDKAITVAHKLYDGNIGSLPVIDAQKTLLGIVTEFDILRAIETEQNLLQIPVSTIMNPRVVSVTEETSFMEIVKLLQEYHLLRVPVVRGTTLVGILARDDVILGYIKATDVGSGG